MMSGRLTPATSLPLKDRLSLKLALLFVATFLAVFLSGLAYDVFATMWENQQTETDSLAQPALKPIEPKIENDLAKVLASAPIPDAVEIKDPFSDKNGISDTAQTRAAVAAASARLGQQQQQPAPQSSVAQNNSGNRPGTSAGSAAGNYPNYPGAGAAGTGVNYVASPEATNDRKRLREEKIRAGRDGGPESTVLAIADLLPVGMVSGGNGETEVMLYSQALQQTFSFPIGTPFYDGWLAELRPDGVGFANANQNGAVFLKGWAHSVKQPTSNNSAEKDSSGRTAGISRED